MYKSHVVEGRLLELHDDYVVTVQGDMISTYHRRYYMLPEEELTVEAAAEAAEDTLMFAAGNDEEVRTSAKGLKLRRPHFAWPAFLNRDANRA